MPQPHISVFKYPLGFIRLIEFLFIVLAIAAVNSWSFSMSYECPPPSGTTPIPPPPPPKTVKATTFTLSKVDVSTCNDTNIKLWSGDNDAGGAAGFFYFVNVAALIFVLIITFVYVVFWDLYQENKRIVLGDLAVTALFFILFFFCSSIWWAGSNTIGYSTGEEEIKKLMDGPIYSKGTEPLGLNRSTNNGKLAISVVGPPLTVYSLLFCSATGCVQFCSPSTVGLYGRRSCRGTRNTPASLDSFFSLGLDNFLPYKSLCPSERGKPVGGGGDYGK